MKRPLLTPMKNNYIRQVIYTGLLTFFLFSVVGVQAQIQPDNNNILYVDKDATGDGTGSSWEHAFSELRDALAWARENWQYTTDGTLQIWVAEGTYTPVVPANPENVTENERNVSFRL